MGAQQSKRAARPVPEPVELLATSAGVIVRLPDRATGASTFHHNARLIQPATVADALQCNAATSSAPASPSSRHVIVARAGAKNSALQHSVVFVAKPPRASTTNSSTTSATLTSATLSSPASTL